MNDIKTTIEELKKLLRQASTADSAPEKIGIHSQAKPLLDHIEIYIHTEHRSDSRLLMAARQIDMALQQLLTPKNRGISGQIWFFNRASNGIDILTQQILKNG